MHIVFYILPAPVKLWYGSPSFHRNLCSCLKRHFSVTEHVHCPCSHWDSSVFLSHSLYSPSDIWFFHQQVEFHLLRFRQGSFLRREKCTEVHLSTFLGQFWGCVNLHATYAWIWCMHSLSLSSLSLSVCLSVCLSLSSWGILFDWWDTKIKELCAK